MVDIDEVKQNLSSNQVVVGLATFKKNMDYGKNRDQLYKGQKCRSEWLLTYGHRQFIKITFIGKNESCLEGIGNKF